MNRARDVTCTLTCLWRSIGEHFTSKLFGVANINDHAISHVYRLLHISARRVNTPVRGFCSIRGRRVSEGVGRDGAAFVKPLLTPAVQKLHLFVTIQP